MILLIERNNEYKISQALPGFHLILKNSVKETHCNGRPKGGLCIAIPSHLCENIKEIDVKNWRLQALTISFGAKSLLLVNVYFPVDDRSGHLNEETDETIAALEEIIAANIVDDVMICGDFNTDFSRRSRQVMRIQE